MRGKAYLVTAVVFSLACLVSGCAISKMHFVKAGISNSQRQADVKACWKYTLSKKGQESANMIRAARIIGGGVFAVAMMVAEGKDPKKDPANFPVHNDCMRAKGYSYKPVSS